MHVCRLVVASPRWVREGEDEKDRKQTENGERRADVEPLERVESAVDREHEGRLDQAENEEEHAQTEAGQLAMSLRPP